jgi:hypothetical protein
VFLLYFSACISILSNYLTKINLNDIFRGMNKKNNYVTHKATCDVWNTSIENGHRPCTCGLLPNPLREKVAEIIRLGTTGNEYLSRDYYELADRILALVTGHTYG